MSTKAPYVLSSSAFQEFLSNSDKWQQWYSTKTAKTENPHALFVSANTFGQARLNNASFLLAEKGAEVKSRERAMEIEESQKLDDLLFELSNAAWKRRILPLNARVMNLVTEAFRTIDEFLLVDKATSVWDISVDTIIEYASAVNWNATLVYSSAYGFEDEGIFSKLDARVSKFRIEDISARTNDTSS